MTPQTIPQTVLLPDLFDRPLVATFDRQHASSDGGAVLLKPKVFVLRNPTVVQANESHDDGKSQARATVTRCPVATSRLGRLPRVPVVEAHRRGPHSD